jgi:DNA polymerase-3 subunit delta
MPLHAFDYLAAPDKHPPAPVTVVFGDKAFLKTLAIRGIRESVLGDDPDAPFVAFQGNDAQWRDVMDELATIALFGGGRRLVIVEDADSFVSKHRQSLEDYASRPKSNGLLVLDVSTWPSNTRLYKIVEQQGLQIECRAPEKTIGKSKELDVAKLRKWLTSWAKQQHEVKLDANAADMLLDLVGPEFGLLDQDLAKLALFAGQGGTVTPEMVRDVVGGWKTKTAWELMDAATDGDAAEALRQLDHLLQSGEHPVALLGQFAWSLRRYAAATRIYEQAERDGRRIPLSEALVEAGFRKWPKEALPRAENQIRQLGRQRALALYPWLLETDLALKGTHSQDDRARFVLEKLFVRLAKKLGPKPQRPRSA